MSIRALTESAPCQEDGINPFCDLDTKVQPEGADAPKIPSKSRIGDLTVSDIRHIFCQLRCMPHLRPDTTLWCGLSAASFSLQYLLMSSSFSNCKRNRADKLLAQRLTADMTEEQSENSSTASAAKGQSYHTSSDAMSDETF